MQRCFSPFVLALGLAWLLPALSHAVQAQLLDSLAIRAQDAVGRSSVIILGYHPDAGMGYDPDLGDKPVPPLPAVEAFDFRFLDPPGMRRMPPTGSYRDIRPAPSIARADTFTVRIQPENNAYPVRLDWQIVQTKRFASAMITAKTDRGEQTTDMKTNDTMDIAAGADPILRMIVRH